MLGTVLFWVILLIVLAGTTIGFLFFRKKSKLTNPVIEVTPLGRGKMGIKTKLKGGWFKHNSTLFGLWDYGQEEVFKCKDGRIILNISSEDFQEINEKMGVVAMRSPEDPRILVPINRMKCENMELLTRIAPADYRGVVVDIVKKAEKETSDKMDKIMQWVFWGGIIIFSFILILLTTQMVKNGQAESKDLILQAGKINADNLKTICGGFSHAGETVISTAP
jgi:hypothetical protein